MHRFWDLARYWSKIADFNLHTSIWRHVGGDPVGIAPRFLASEIRVSWLSYGVFSDPTFSHLCRTPTCGRQTDGQTDGQTDTQWQHIPRGASIASRGKKINQKHSVTGVTDRYGEFDSNKAMALRISSETGGGTGPSGTECSRGSVGRYRRSLDGDKDDGGVLLSVLIASVSNLQSHRSSFFKSAASPRFITHSTEASVEMASVIACSSVVARRAARSCGSSHALCMVVVSQRWRVIIIFVIDVDKSIIHRIHFHKSRLAFHTSRLPGGECNAAYVHHLKHFSLSLSLSLSLCVCLSLSLSVCL